jgi:hypothetical protein
VRTRRFIVTLGVLAVLGGGGFLAARLVSNSIGTEAQQPGQVDEKLIQQRQQTEREQPRFTGELLGIFIAPSEDLLPEQARRQQDERRVMDCRHVTPPRGGELDFPRPLALPSEYVLKQERPEAVACDGELTGMGWDFTTAGANGIPASVSITRGRSTASVYDVAADRVSVRNIGGRDAIFIRPITPDGLAQISYVVFPESFGVTEIQTFNFSEEGLLAVAEAVAEAGK